MAVTPVDYLYWVSFRIFDCMILIWNSMSWGIDCTYDIITCCVDLCFPYYTGLDVKWCSHFSKLEQWRLIQIYVISAKMTISYHRPVWLCFMACWQQISMDMLTWPILYQGLFNSYESFWYTYTHALFGICILLGNEVISVISCSTPSSLDPKRLKEMQILQSVW